jgi:hypothetical protein
VLAGCWTVPSGNDDEDDDDGRGRGDFGDVGPPLAAIFEALPLFVAFVAKVADFVSVGRGEGEDAGCPLAFVALVAGLLEAVPSTLLLRAGDGGFGDVAIIGESEACAMKLGVGRP